MAETTTTNEGIIMSWSECKIEIGVAASGGAAMPSSLSSVGTIKDKSTVLEPSDGDVLEMKRTGGKRVARLIANGGLTLKTRIIEPSDTLYTTLGLGSVDSTSSELEVTTHIVPGNYGVKLTPKNIGAKGLKIPYAGVAFKPGYSEEDGHYVDLEFEILQGAADYWYSKFTVAAGDWS